MHFLSQSLVIALTAAQILGILTAIHAIMYTRTPQGAIAWIFALVFLPIVAIPLYLVLGRTHFPGYIEARRARTDGDAKVKLLTNSVISKLSPHTKRIPPDRAGLLECLSDLVNLPLTRNNDVKILIDGEQTFHSLFESINSAKEYLLVEFFIIKDDNLGDELQKLLIEKAKQGVKVYLLFDEIGSRKLPAKYLNAFRSEENVFISPFGGKRKWFSNIIRLNFRNHRKIVIVDGQTAFIGGLNVGMEYMGKGKLGAWRDTFIRIKGPALQCIQLAFQEDWHWATETVLDIPNHPEPQSADKSILIIPSGPADVMETWKLSTIALINAAHTRFWIASPYFVPGEGILTALQMAALRGVDVRILLPNKADHLLVYGSSFTYYPETLPYGIKIYRYTDGFLHEKVMLIDDDLSVIGTANLDNRSMRLNFEINSLIYNEETARDIKNMFTRDFERSIPVKRTDFTKHNWFFRIGCRIARLMAPIQ